MENLVRQFAAEAAPLALRAAAGLLLFVVFWLAGTVAHRLTGRVAGRMEPARGDITRLLGRTAKISLVVFGAVSALGTVGVNVSALVAGLGLTGFALGFALRDALSNVLAGMLILLYRPFRRDDYISVTGFSGTVIDLDFRYTTLEVEGQRFLIPNSILFTNPIALGRTRR
jgi:small conductance mechanosensitive channel